MSNTSEIIKHIHKTHGKGIARMGNDKYEDCARIPTGIFPFDLASGGGFPMGRMSLVVGPESSNKTNLVLNAIGQGQQIYPDKQAVFIDAEDAFNGPWAEKMGVDTSRLIVLKPEYAEQAVDFVDALVHADDVFLVALDSIAALSVSAEMEASAERVQVGGSALVVNKMFKKLSPAYNKLRNAGKNPPALVCINQLRHKVAIGPHGNPETWPGGMAQNYSSSFTVRVYGKNEIDKKINAVLPAFKVVSLVIKKWKMPILAMNSEYRMQMIPGGGHGPGWCNDWNTLKTYLEELNYLTKGDKSWNMFGEEFKLLNDCREHLYGNPELLREAKATIIKEMLAKGSIAPTEEEEEAVEDE